MAPAYQLSHTHGTPVLGTFHASDILQFFFGVYDNYAAKSIRTYYFNFLYSLDPNADLDGTYPEWPSWRNTTALMNFGADKTTVIQDNFRAESYEVIKKIGSALRL